MTMPYYCALYALSLMRGPNIHNWVNEHVLDLQEKTIKQQNPIGYDKEILWKDVCQSFKAAFIDTVEKQNSYQKLIQFKMYKNNLDIYSILPHSRTSLRKQDIIKMLQNAYTSLPMGSTSISSTDFSTEIGHQIP